MAATGRFVSEKFAEVAPGTLATTLYGPPAVPFAVNVVDVATPVALLTAVFVPVNVPLAPLGGAGNVTVAPLTGLCPASVDRGRRGWPDGPLVASRCPEP